ncbi:MAG TPA: hypothetical protein VD995_01515 [Azospirillum sp.]|nr:hypothetical protein [Azospirillum sp.]
MTTANSHPPAPSRTLRLLTGAAPVLNPVLAAVAYVAGGAGFAVAMLEENGAGLLVSMALLGAAAALYVLTRPAEDE